MKYPAYFKNHDASAFICLLDETKYLEVRRLENSHRVQFGKSIGIAQMAVSEYLPASLDEFEEKLSGQVQNLITISESIIQ